MFLLYWPPISNKTFVIWPNEQHLVEFISSSKIFSLFSATKFNFSIKCSDFSKFNWWSIFSIKIWYFFSLSKALITSLLVKVGDPSSFKEILLENNISVVKEIIFPDHHKYEKKDIEKVIQESKKLNAKILTTEKDFTKLSDDDVREINFLKIELKIINEEKFINLINDTLN